LLVNTGPRITSDEHFPSSQRAYEPASNATMFEKLRQVFSFQKKEVKDLLLELEEKLIEADVGWMTAEALLNRVKAEAPSTSEQVSIILKNTILEWLQPKEPWGFKPLKPHTILFVGVNGTGKTTSVGKLAALWRKEGKQVMVVGADTFRAAAVDQARIWAERAGVEFYSGASQSDPASVVFDGIQKAKNSGTDVVLIDTAGRLHTQISLMDELKKMVRVAEKALGRPTDDVFLVLDASLGQNSLAQALQFMAHLPLTGLVLTKLDGTSKGGVVLSAVRETGLPLRFIGLGESKDSMQIFNPARFVQKLVE